MPVPGVARIPTVFHTFAGRERQLTRSHCLGPSQILESGTFHVPGNLASSECELRDEVVGLQI